MKRDKIKEKMLTIYTLKNYALIMPYVRPYWFRAMLAILITIPVGAMDAVIAWSLKPFMDIVLVEKQTGWTMYIPLMIIVFSILQALFTYLATYMNTWVGNKISLNVKRNLFNKLIHRDMSFFDATNSGEILFRYETDADMACGGLLNNMRLLSTRLFSSISLIIVLFYNSWKLAIVAVVVLFGALMPLTRIRKRLKKVVAKDVNVMAETMKHYNEAYSGNRIISAYNLFDYCKKKFVTTINDLFDLSIQIVAKTGIISPIMHVISSFGIAFVIWYGSHLIVTHQMTVGNFASFITSLVMLYNPIKSIGNNFSSVIFSLMAVERVFSVLQMPNKIQNNHKALCPPNIRGDIVYNDVSFAYQPNKPVLRHIHLDIKAGQTIALVGNSGGGKTTISTLLPRFYDVTGGEITIDGVNIKDFDLNYLRDNIAIVFQDNFLFGTTIRENILFGRTDVSEDDLQKAVEAACLSEFIATLDQGLDTQIGERGVTLSGGQKQRIAIARAFIKNAPILILDEATSALDNKSEAVVQQAIDNLMKDRTVLVIAHRLSTVRNADCIIVINNGEIAEKGSHEELLQNEGAYAALYKTQLV
ncbi:MAG: ABC transporter ATP-binding protein [Alphaproteobacteria bacterium]|nr:ABC transporter ATP-binding protein [Alphaproteobacteria bacterium]